MWKQIIDFPDYENNILKKLKFLSYYKIKCQNIQS